MLLVFFFLSLGGGFFSGVLEMNAYCGRICRDVCIGGFFFISSAVHALIVFLTFGFGD